MIKPLLYIYIYIGRSLTYTYTRITPNKIYFKIRLQLRATSQRIGLIEVRMSHLKKLILLNGFYTNLIIG